MARAGLPDLLMGAVHRVERMRASARIFSAGIILLRPAI
jgi:hypothetical protein